MKPNAPEKIYVDSKAIGDGISTTINTKRQDYPTCTEYTRTDFFIEKAAEWLKNKAENYIVDTPLCSYFDYKRAVEDFKEYMKGE